MSALDVWEGLFVILLKELERPLPPPSLSAYRASNPSSQSEVIVSEKEDFDNLRLVLESVHGNSTKFSIAASGEAALEDYLPMAMILNESLANLLAVFQSSAKHSSDAKLRLLQCAGIKVYETVKGLVFEAFRLQGQGGGSMDQLAPITGRVWEACEEMQKIPCEDNKCASIAARSEIRILKDALEELQGTIKSQKKASSSDELFECTIPHDRLISLLTSVKTTLSLLTNIDRLLLLSDFITVSDRPFECTLLCDEIVVVIRDIVEQIDEAVSSTYESLECLTESEEQLRKAIGRLIDILERERPLIPDAIYEDLSKYFQLTRQIISPKQM